MKLIVANSTEEMAKLSAKQAADVLNAAIAKKGSARLLLSTGASQLEFFKEFVKQDVAWHKVEMFHLDEAALEASLEPSKYVGCSAHQVERFLNDVIRPLLKENEADLGMKAEINV